LRLLFPAATFGCASVLLMLVIWAYFSLFSYSEKDNQRYHALVAAADPSIKPVTPIPYKTTQQHRQACKEIWFTQGSERLQLRIRSEDSELILDHCDDSMEIAEKMQGVTCVMQEELYYSDGKPMQVFRYLQADEAVYHYQTNKLVAKRATISRFSALGHHLIEDVSRLRPSITGTASEVEFFMEGGNPHFKATKFKASLDTQGAK